VKLQHMKYTNIKWFIIIIIIIIIIIFFFTNTIIIYIYIYILVSVMLKLVLASTSLSTSPRIPLAPRHVSKRKFRQIIYFRLLQAISAALLIVYDIFKYTILFTFSLFRASIFIWQSITLRPNNSIKNLISATLVLGHLSYW
jgi:hypothetical protein